MLFYGKSGSNTKPVAAVDTGDGFGLRSVGNFQLNLRLGWYGISMNIY